MVPSILFMFFGMLFAAMLVSTGAVGWPVGVLIGIGLVLLERLFFRASHATDGDEASDETHHETGRTRRASLPPEFYMEADRLDSEMPSPHAH